MAQSSTDPGEETMQSMCRAWRFERELFVGTHADHPKPCKADPACLPGIQGMPNTAMPCQDGCTEGRFRWRIVRVCTGTSCTGTGPVERMQNAQSWVGAEEADPPCDGLHYLHVSPTTAPARTAPRLSGSDDVHLSSLVWPPEQELF